jgi:hypothetical protein
VLACLESFLVELGHSVTQAEMLAHHRDICFNPPPRDHTYGAIDEHRLKQLAGRYLCAADDFPNTDEAQIANQLSIPREALIACCYRFQAQDNLNHCIRLTDVKQGTLDFLCPLFPNGTEESVVLADFFAQWQPTVLKLRSGQ